MGVLQPGSALTQDADFSAPLMQPRGADLADFTYGELCFNIDTFYGRPGQELIHDALEDGGLDEVLSTRYPEVKEKLLSTDFDKFFSGLNLLVHGLLFDGGHTAMVSKLLTDAGDTAGAAMDELIQSDYGMGFAGIAVGYITNSLMAAARYNTYGDDFYAEKGDTAMIFFDEFVVDNDAWKAYYAGEGSLPVENDTLGTINAGLTRASANPEIRNVVIDISCNGGGNTAALNAIEWLLTGKGYMNYENLLSGQTTTEGYEVDANFDGSFDGGDQPFTQFRYGVLTSGASFSCGNAFPFFMKEHGAMILGMPSGGGACAIRICSIGGVECSTSAASSRMVTDKGESVDNGCPVDKEITVEFTAMEGITEENAEEAFDALMADAASFYDLDVISAAMNEFFGTAALDQAA